MYHAVSFGLTSNGGPPPQWYDHGNQHNNPLNFFPSSLRNAGVVALVPADTARPPVVELAPQLLQILPAQQPPVVDHPDNDNYKVMDD